MKRVSRLLDLFHPLLSAISNPLGLTSWHMLDEYVFLEDELKLQSKVLLMSSQKRHQRTFSEDDRIQAQENVKKVEDDDAGEISEPEDPLMLSRDAKDWKVRFPFLDYISI